MNNSAYTLSWFGLFALCGVFSLCYGQESSLLEQSTIGFSQWNGAHSVANFGSLKDSINTITTEGSNYVLTATNGNFVTSRNPDTWTLTVMLDLTQLQNPSADTLLVALANNATTDPVQAIGFGITNDRKACPWWETAKNGNNNTPVLQNTGTVILSVISGQGGNISTTGYNGRIYVDSGTSYYSQSQSNGFRVSKQNLNQLKIDTTLSSAIMQIYVHDSVLTNEQITQSMTEMRSLPVPEPATVLLTALAPLSLGLRRKRVG